MGQNESNAKSSVASWGTGNTAYTELVDNQETKTVSSSITVDTAIMTAKDIQQRKDSVIGILRNKGVPENTISDIIRNQAPYELAFSGVHLSTWNTDKEIFLIMALLGSMTPQQTVDNHDDDL